MTLFVVCSVAFGASLLTLFSGFGLGTLLLPAFVLFFPVELAVTATAIVHAANSFFKVWILREDIDATIVRRFGVPALLAAFGGAWVLTGLSGMDPLFHWTSRAGSHEVLPVSLVMGSLILGFALLELAPKLRDLRAPVRFLPLGGALSGFFGGLSGHQGALRAAFLTPLGLEPKPFAATQAAIASLVDVARLSVYFAAFLAGSLVVPQSTGVWGVVVAATVAAFTGALVGRRLLEKATIDGVRVLTGALLLAVGLGLVTGLL